MKVRTIIIGVVIIAGLGAYLLSRSPTETSSLQTNNLVNTESSEYRTFSAMRGEDYDRTFIANMIAHHQGAVDMAHLVLINTQRQELKDMANALIVTQTKEINDMAAWQKQWGYPPSSGDTMEDHSAMGMAHDMANMTDKLKTVPIENFDKEFLAFMIEHHQSAIDMATPGHTNAAHQEIKTLTTSMVDSQSKEINQMRQWQREWGYD